MSDFFETVPKVQIIYGSDPNHARVFINFQEWSQWITKVGVESEVDALTQVTIRFVANMVGDTKEGDE